MEVTTRYDWNQLLAAAEPEKWTDSEARWRLAERRLQFVAAAFCALTFGLYAALRNDRHIAVLSSGAASILSSIAVAYMHSVKKFPKDANIVVKEVQDIVRRGDLKALNALPYKKEVDKIFKTAIDGGFWYFASSPISDLTKSQKGLLKEKLLEKFKSQKGVFSATHFLESYGNLAKRLGITRSDINDFSPSLDGQGFGNFEELARFLKDWASLVELAKDLPGEEPLFPQATEVIVEKVACLIILKDYRYNWHDAHQALSPSDNLIRFNWKRAYLMALDHHLKFDDWNFEEFRAAFLITDLSGSILEGNSSDTEPRKDRLANMIEDDAVQGKSIRSLNDITRLGIPALAKGIKLEEGFLERIERTVVNRAFERRNDTGLFILLSENPGILDKLEEKQKKQLQQEIKEAYPDMRESMHFDDQLSCMIVSDFCLLARPSLTTFSAAIASHGGEERVKAAFKSTEAEKVQNIFLYLPYSTFHQFKHLAPLRAGVSDNAFLQTQMEFAKTHSKEDMIAIHGKEAMRFIDQLKDW